MPEAVLAPTTIPIVSPRVALAPPQATTPAQAPVQSVSPQDANASVPTYPGIPEPGQDPVSLQATVLRLKEIVEMLTGTRAGGSETDVVGGYLLLQKSTANSSARLEIINQVTANANFAMASHITILDAEFKNTTGLDPDGTTFKAHLDETLQVYTDADEALAFRALNLESALVMTSGTNASARLNSIESTNVTQGTNITANANRITTLETTINTPGTGVTARLSTVESVNVTQSADIGTNAANISAVASRTTNLETTINTPGSGVTARLTTVESVAATANANAATAVVKFGVTGTINGVSGGFTFSGVLRNDGAVSYFMEFEVGTFILRNPATGAAAAVFDFNYPTNQFTFNGNVTIHGNLVVDGTINGVKITNGAVSNPKVLDNAISNNSAGSGSIGFGSRVGTSLSVRQGGRVLIVAMLIDGSGSFRTAGAFGGFYPIFNCGVYVNGSLLGYLNVLDGVVATQALGSGIYQFYRATFPSAVQLIHGPLSAGFYTYEVQNDTGFGATFTISVTELAK